VILDCHLGARMRGKVTKVCRPLSKELGIGLFGRMIRVWPEEVA
jgi:hypothetical protein